MKNLMKVALITLTLGLTILPFSHTTEVEGNFHNAAGIPPYSDEDYPSPIVKY